MDLVDTVHTANGLSSRLYCGRYQAYKCGSSVPSYAEPSPLFLILRRFGYETNELSKSY